MPKGALGLACAVLYIGGSVVGCHPLSIWKVLVEQHVGFGSMRCHLIYAGHQCIVALIPASLAFDVGHVMPTLYMHAISQPIAHCQQFAGCVQGSVGFRLSLTPHP